MNALDIALSSLTFLTTREKFLLRKNLDSLDALAVLSIQDISKMAGRPVRPESFDMAELVHRTGKALECMDVKQITAIRYDESEFPALLREIHDPPYMLYCRGNLKVLEKSCISVVGTRQVCRQSAEAAFDFSRDAGRDGLCIVSGLALGIDSFAHRGSLASGEYAASCAVLPCGIDTVVPYSNRSLASALLRSGSLIISEYGPSIEAMPFRFVQRNRIIAALSEATVVMQAPCSSGALITADYALDFNRDLMFHSACFCDEARRIEALSLKREKSPARKSRLPSAYVEQGAPIINNYGEFLEVLENQKKGNFQKKEQPELFTEFSG